MSSVKWRQFCLGLNVLRNIKVDYIFYSFLNFEIAQAFLHLIYNKDLCFSCVITTLADADVTT